MFNKLIEGQTSNLYESDLQNILDNAYKNSKYIVEYKKQYSMNIFGSHNFKPDAMVKFNNGLWGIIENKVTYRSHYSFRKHMTQGIGYKEQLNYCDIIFLNTEKTMTVVFAYENIEPLTYYKSYYRQYSDTCICDIHKYVKLNLNKFKYHTFNICDYKSFDSILSDAFQLYEKNLRIN